jgi:hypothetical protein
MMHSFGRRRARARLRNGLWARVRGPARGDVAVRVDRGGLAEEQRDVVRASPDPRQRRAAALFLARALREDLDRTADVDEAIDLYRRAVAVTPSHSAEHAVYLSNLGGAWQARATLTGRDEDARAALEALTGSAASAHGNHPRRADMLYTLATLPNGRPDPRHRKLQWGRLLDLRADLSRLADRDPSLFAALDRVRASSTGAEPRPASATRERGGRGQASPCAAGTGRAIRVNRPTRSGRIVRNAVTVCGPAPSCRSTIEPGRVFPSTLWMID